MEAGQFFNARRTLTACLRSIGSTVFPNISAALLDELWETYERKKSLEKFEFALLLGEKPPVDRSAAVYQDVQIVIDLRDALVHFKPEWDDLAARHEKLSTKIKCKFEQVPSLMTG